MVHYGPLQIKQLRRQYGLAPPPGNVPLDFGGALPIVRRDTKNMGHKSRVILRKCALTESITGTCATGNPSL